MKYVYVLTSNETDYYCEQCIISMISLLKHNPSAELVLLVDNQTHKTLTGFRAEALRFTSETIVENFPDTVTQKVRSRLLKTSIRRLVKGKFLFIDLDTVVCDRLDMIEEIQTDVAMVLDKHVCISEHYMYMYMYMNMNAKRMGYSVGYEDKHFNSGVIYVNDTEKAYHFFDLWNKLYLETLEKGIDIDQTALNEANVRENGIIQEIDGIWNVQINCGLKYLSEAKIIHYLGYQPMSKQNIYFNTLPFKLCDAQYFENMKKQKCLTEEIKEVIDHPKRAFKVVVIIPEDCVAYKLLFSNHMRILKFVYVRLNYIYKFMEKILAGLFRIIFRRI